MKNLFLFLVIMIIASCDSKTKPQRKTSQTEKESSSKWLFLQEERIGKTLPICKQLIGYLKEDDLADALSLFNWNRYTNEDDNRRMNKIGKDCINDIRLTVKKFGLVPEKEWEVKFDTVFTEKNTPWGIDTLIAVNENVNIKVIHTEKDAHEQMFIHIFFVLDSDASAPMLINYAVLAPLSNLDEKTGKLVKSETSPSPLKEQLQKLQRLRDEGVLTDEEFYAERQKILHE